MCGIIGVVRRRSTRVPPELAALIAELDGAVAHLEGWNGHAANLTEAATSLEHANEALGGVPGVRALLADRTGALGIEHRADVVADLLDRADLALDAG